MAKGNYDFNDFRKHVVQMRSMGSFSKYMSSIPGLNEVSQKPGGIDVEREIKRILGMIDSMTPLERSYPFLMTLPARCHRIAEGAGVDSARLDFRRSGDVNLPCGWARW